MDRLRGKTCLVTAAGQGIGRATAVAMAREGGRVLATDINADALADLAVQNFIEMRDKTASRLFRTKKKLDHTLEGLLPGIYLPLYTMVTFTGIPYAKAAARAQRQDRIVYAVLGAFVLLLLLALFVLS